MKTILFTMICLLSSGSISGQILDKLDAEFSYGFMRSFNKSNIVTDTFFSYLSVSYVDIENESYINTKRFNMQLSYHFNQKHSISIGYSSGEVGSRLTGMTRSFDDVSSFSSRLDKTRNVFVYKSFDLNYKFTYPLGKNNIITSIGLQRQKNGIEDTFIPVSGIYEVNYNASLSLGFAQELYQSIFIVPKVIMINSFRNNREQTANSSFVPIQIGFELGLRFGLEILN